MTEKVILRWQDIFVQTDAIVKQIEAGTERFTRVVGIRNGGVIPAKRIALLLDVPYSDIRISFYKGTDIQTKISSDSISENELAQLFNWEVEHVLFVDDLIDSGRTIKWLEKVLTKNNVENYSIAALYAKKISKNKYIGSRKPEGWLVFPWEES